MVKAYKGGPIKKNKNVMILSLDISICGSFLHKNMNNKKSYFSEFFQSLKNFQICSN